MITMLISKNYDNEYPLNITNQSIDTAVLSLETVMKFVRTFPCSEKQIHSVCELQVSAEPIAAVLN